MGSLVNELTIPGLFVVIFMAIAFLLKLGIIFYVVKTILKTGIDRKKCPFCAEFIKKEANDCRFCQKNLI